jgi:two-component system heavy metal sensor histidine kinase CusS
LSEAKVAATTGSLGVRLSWWLAAQSLVGLLIVLALVYVVSSSSQDKRQAESLQQKQAIVNHLLGEVDAAGDLAVLRHKLDDFFLGHTDLRVRLQGPANQVLYENNFAATSTRPTRSIAYEAPVRIDNLPVRVLLELDTTADRVALTQLAWTLGISALLGSALISVGGFVLVRAGLSPVRGLVHQTDALDASTMGQRLDGSQQPRELQPLVHRFNGLLDRLQGAYDQLEGFNANVAHELCTPLATLITSTEVVLRRPHAGEAHRDVLESNLEELHRLTGIVNDMLFLSRADRGAKARSEHVDSLASLSAEVVDYHSAAAEEVGVGFSVVGDAKIDCDPGLMRRALSNLLANATRYAERGSDIVLKITGAPGHIELAVSNRGPTIPQEHQARLFDRFYRADPSRADAVQHHGLGLAIVAAIARMHGGEALVRSEQGLTTFGLRIPASR